MSFLRDLDVSEFLGRHVSRYEAWGNGLDGLSKTSYLRAYVWEGAVFVPDKEKCESIAVSSS